MKFGSPTYTVGEKQRDFTGTLATPAYYPRSFNVYVFSNSTNANATGECHGVFIVTVMWIFVPFAYTVHDTENLTFSEEFCGCSARTPADSCAERHGFSTRVPRNFRAGGCRSYVRIRVENGGNQKANVVHNNRLKDRETRPKDRSNIYALGYLCLTFAEFRMESANCSARNPLIVRAESADCPCGHTRMAARLYADYPCGRLRKSKFSVSCTVIQFTLPCCSNEYWRIMHWFWVVCLFSKYANLCHLITLHTHW